MNTQNHNRVVPVAPKGGRVEVIRTEIADGVYDTGRPGDRRLAVAVDRMIDHAAAEITADRAASRAASRGMSAPQPSRRPKRPKR